VVTIPEWVSVMLVLGGKRDQEAGTKLCSGVNTAMRDGEQ
jgi:hypothetical protein